MKLLRCYYLKNDRGFILPLVLSVLSMVLVLILSMTVTYVSEMKYLTSATKSYEYNSLKLLAIKKALLHTEDVTQTFYYNNRYAIRVDILSDELEQVKCTVTLTIDGMTQKNAVIYNKNQKRIVSWVEM